MVRDGSQIVILLPAEFLETNIEEPLKECTSQESSTLALKTCSLTRNTRRDFVLAATLRYIESQKQFTLLVNLNNPATAKSDYQFSAMLSRKGVEYAQAPSGFSA